MSGVDGGVAHGVVGAASPGPLDAPVLEHALLPVLPGRGADFEAAFDRARPFVEEIPGFRGLRLSRCVERPDTFLLLIGWDSVEAHTHGFRGSPGYERWRSLLHPFYDPFPVVEHYVAVVGP